MTTYTITIDEKSKEGRGLIAKLKSSVGVIGVRRSTTITKQKLNTERRKAKSELEAKEDNALAMLMKSEETGKLVSKAAIMKALKAVK